MVALAVLVVAIAVISFALGIFVAEAFYGRGEDE